MNRSKARDFFSDYYEDSLSPGLRQTMEKAFADDQELKRDYQAFVALIGNLDSLRSEQAEPVGFLSERIEARLNQIDQERRTTQRPFLLRFWAPVTATAIAGAAVLGFLFALQPEAAGGGTGASMTGDSPKFLPTTTPRLAVEDGVTYLSYKASAMVHVTVRKGLGGEIIDSFDLDNRMMRSPLVNSADKSQVLEIEFSNSKTKLWIALPGQVHSKGGPGKGSVIEFAEALADTYQMPVEISTQYPHSEIEWTLNPSDPISTIDDPLKELGITIDHRESQVLLLAE